MKTCVRLLIAGVLLTALNTVARADLADGLALYYSFNTPSDTTVADESGNNRSAAVRGATHVAQGRLGGAYAFDGVDDFIEVLSSPPAGPQYTLSFWFTSGAEANFAEGRQLISDNRRYQIGGRLDGGNKHLYTYALNTSDFGPAFEMVSSPLCLEQDTWHHVALVVDEAARPVGLLYVDGRLVAAETIDGVNLGGIQFVIGALNNGGLQPGFFWQGLIDEVRVHSRPLAAEEVLALYQLSDTPPPEPAAGPVLGIGFSDVAGGPQDVTEFMAGETLFVRVQDVLLPASAPHARIDVLLKQKVKREREPRRAEFRLQPQADGSFLGSQSLSLFQTGRVDVTIRGCTRDGDRLRYDTELRIH